MKRTEWLAVAAIATLTLTATDGLANSIRTDKSPW